MLTESEVQRSFRKLFKNTEVTSDLIERAETMLEDLRPESPLRHRLTNELDELRELAQSAT